MLKKNFVIFIILFFSINVCGCQHPGKVLISLLNACQESTDSKTLQEQQDQFTDNYAKANKLDDTLKTTNIDSVKLVIANDSKSAEIYKDINGYSNICGIMSANNGIIINGNVAVYGGLYTQGNIQMANGALAVVNNSYIDKIATYPVIYNGEVFSSDVLKHDSFEKIIKSKPVNIQNVKRRIKLLNISAVSNDEQ